MRASRARATRAACALVLGVLGCGDNLEPAPVEVCAPPPPALPTTGPLLDPYALPLPGSCVEGGLERLPGRWFLHDPMARFSFEYPLYEGTCDSGFRRAYWIGEDHDDSDGGTFYTWSDGTRIYFRDHVHFEYPGGFFEYAQVTVACMLPDGTLAGVRATYDTDRGERTTTLVGTRYAPKDSGARGLTLVGEVGGFRGYNVAIDGTHAYVVGPDGLRIVDVADPAAPAVVGEVNGKFNDVKLVRSIDKLVAYTSPIDDERTGIIDVTTASAPSFIGTVADYSHSVYVTPGSSPRLYLATYGTTIPVYDVTNPLVPVRLGAIPVAGPDPMAGIHDIHVAGDRVYAMKTTDGVVALDIAPGLTTPTNLGRLPTSYSHAGWEATLGGRRVFLHGDEGQTPDGGAFLRIIDADPQSSTFMTELSRYQAQEEISIHNIQVVGDRAYIAYYQDGVRVLDLASPFAPREVGYFNTWDTTTAPGAAFEGAVGISVIGDLVYVADFARGLLILRITP